MIFSLIALKNNAGPSEQMAMRSKPAASND